MVQARKLIGIYHTSRYATTRCYLLKRFLLLSTDHEITVMEKQRYWNTGPGKSPRDLCLLGTD